MIGWLQGKKTYIVMAAAVIGAIAGLATGELTLTQMISAIIAAAGFGALRSGIKKVEPK